MTEISEERSNQRPEHSSSLHCNGCEGVKRVQLSLIGLFLSSARPATAPASFAAFPMYDGAKVLEHVTSQTSSLPLSHGTNVIPLGLLPSKLETPFGSIRDRTLPDERAQCTMSLREL